MNIDLLELRELMRKECSKNYVTCSGCKFRCFRLSICNIKTISDAELKKLNEIMRDAQAVREDCGKLKQYLTTPLPFDDLVGEFSEHLARILGGDSGEH